MLIHIPFYSTLLFRDLDGVQATHSHILVYGAIEAHSIGRKGCIASNATIAEETGLKIATVSKTLSQLAKAGWIGVEMDGNSHRVCINPLLEIVKPLLPSKGTPYSPVNIDSSNRSTVAKATVPRREKEQKLLEIVNKNTGRSFRTLPARGVKKTLDAFTLEEIDSALSSLVVDPWHKERIKGLSVDYLIRSTTIDRFLMANQPTRAERNAAVLAEMDD